ncbi:hypothetical protein TcCL_ESM09411 [Trypanosoma cruzi]|nr:hypothetical protein TcCL_ESM09411 [Trypanosoma cruzi]
MPSRARGIETPSFTRGRKRRIIAYRRAKLECAVAGREQQLEATRAQLQEREARAGAREAQRAAREAETAGREEAPTSRRGPADGPDTRQNTAGDGVTKQPQRPTRRLVVGGAPPRTARRSPADERRWVIPHSSQGNFGRLRFYPSIAFALSHPPLGRPFCHRRSGTKFSRVRRHLSGRTCVE